MKKAIIIIIASTWLVQSVQSQWEFGWDWWGKRSGTGSSYTIPIGMIDTTVFPPTPYGDLYIDIQHDQIMRYYNIHQLRDLILDTSPPSFEIGFDMFINSVDRDLWSTIWGMSANNIDLGVQNFTFFSYKDSLFLKIQDTLWNIFDFNGDTSWSSYVFGYDSTINTLYLNKNGIPVFTRVTTFKDTVKNDDDTLQTLSFGGSGHKMNEDPALFRAYCNFKGGFDNIYIKIRGDTLGKSNCNDGGTTQPSNKFLWWKAPKSIDGHGIWMWDWGPWLGFEFNSHSNDELTPTYKVRDSGLRKDTCYYFPIQENDVVGNRGVQNWTPGYDAFVGSVCNKVIVNPWDSTEMMMLGAFNTLGSTTVLDSFVAIYLLRKDTAVSLNGGGISWPGSSTNGFNGVWQNDSIFYFAHSGDSVDNINHIYSPKIARVNVHTGNWDSLSATSEYPLELGLMQGIKIFHDTLWLFRATKYLVAYSLQNETWAVTDSFANDRVPATTWGAVPDLLQMGDDSLFAVEPGYGVWQIIGGRKIKLVCDLPNPYDIFCWYSSSTYDPVTKRVYFGNINYHIDTTLARGLSYYKNGEVVCVAVVDSSDGYTGDFRPVVLGTTIWNGKVICVGQFKTVDGKMASNIFMWDEVNGSQALDYAVDWVDFGVTTYNTIVDGVVYKDLVVSGDWLSAGGVRFNHVAKRYGTAHLKVVKPRFENVNNLPDSIYKSQYPPASYTFDTYSPTRRALTVVTRFKIGVNGTYSNITATKKDSLLDANLRGYWTYTYSTQLTGDSSFVDAGDTIYYYEQTTDDYANVTTTSARTMRVIADPIEVTSGISYHWNYDTLTITPITNWVDSVNGLTLTQSDNTLKPILSSGVVFDSLSSLLASSPDTTLLSHNWTVVLVMKITDTNTVSNQFVFGSYTNSGTMLNMLAFKVMTDVSPRLKLGVGYNNGTGNTYRTYPTNTGSHYNTFSVFIITADSVNKQSLYVNNIQATSGGAGYSTNEETPGIGLGDMLGVGSWGMKNSTIRLVKIFPRVFNASEITQESFYQILNNCQ